MLLMVSGCVGVGHKKIDTLERESSVAYRSELTASEAKALFAFTQFRISGAESHWRSAFAALKRAISFDPKSDYLQLALAKAYLHQHQPRQAITALTILFNRDPDHIVGLELRGDLYNYQHDYTAAIDQYRHVLKLQPERESTQLRLAMTFIQLEQKDEAIVLLEHLLERHSSVGLAQLALARLWVEKKRFNKAMNVYRQLLKQYPDQLRAVLEYGMLLEKFDHTAAKELYQEVLARNPRAAAVRQQLGQYFLGCQQFAAALEQFQSVLQQFPDNPQILNRIGLIQLEQKKWLGAENSFRALLEGDAPHDRSRYYLAMALSAQQKMAAAIAVLAPLDDTSPVYPEAALQLAYLYQKTDQNDLAITTLQQLVKHDTHQSDAYFYLVVFFSDRDDYEQALEIAQEGVSKNPAVLQLRYQLGVMYEKTGDRSAAVAMMESVLELDDTHADALNFLAYDQAENGVNLELALSRAQRALALKPSGYVIDTLGWIYFKMKRYSESQKQLEKAVILHPDDAVIQEHLGDLYCAMNLWDQAVAAYQKVLEINSGAVMVEEKLKRLQEEG